jgi:type IV pilus assembly protein PilC
MPGQRIQSPPMALSRPAASQRSPGASSQPAGSTRAQAASKPAGLLSRKSTDRVRVKPRELAIFTRQLSVMISSGLPLIQTLEILAEQQDNKGFAEALRRIRATVEGGSTLAAAFQRYPKIFDALYTNMLEAGETGGILEGVLQRLSSYIEKAVKLRAAVKSALIYPTAVVVIATGVIIGLLWKVVPIFATLFAGLNATMPLPTRIVIALSHGVVRFSWLIVLAAIAAPVGLRRYHATPQGREYIDGVILRLPVLGMLMRKIAVARFSRTLSTLITSGVPMLESLDITGRTAGNAVIEKAIAGVRNEVEAGHTVANPMRRSGAFPNMVVQMVEVGEQTGALDAMLQKVADFYEDEVDVAIKDLLSALEPAIIVFLGVAVGGIVISMYLPLFSLIGKLAG